MLKITLFVAIILSLCLVSNNSCLLASEDITVNATVDKKTLAQDEELNLKVEISASTKQAPTVELPSLEDFYVLSSLQSQNYSVSRDNKVQLKVVLQYILMPNKQGKLTIGPFTVKNKLKTYKSEPIEIQVGSPKKPLPEKPKEEPEEQEQAPSEEGVIL